MALAFGIPVVEIFDRLSAWELQYWEAFEKVEGPIGYRRDDQLAGFGAWVSGNLKKGTDPIKAVALVSHFFDKVRDGVSNLVAKKIDRKKVEEGDRGAVNKLAQKVFAIFGAPPDGDRKT